MICSTVVERYTFLIHCKTRCVKATYLWECRKSMVHTLSYWLFVLLVLRFFSNIMNIRQYRCLRQMWESSDVFLTFMFADFAFFQLVVGLIVQVVLCTAGVVADICVMICSTDSRERFCAREFHAMHEFGMCRKQGTYACSTPGPARRDFTPGGKCTPQDFHILW